MRDLRAADSLPILVRPSEHGDENYIRSSWLRSNESSPVARTFGRKAYYSGHHQLVCRLLARHPVRVACSVDAPDTIVGWACVEPPSVVHYVFVREEFRRYGVARRLLADLPERVTYTHRTDVCKALPIPAAWFFNMYRAFIPGKEAA